jgi:hypothetical protein
MIEARLRDSILRITKPALGITFFRTLAVLTGIRLIIGLWAVRHQLLVTLRDGGDLTSGGRVSAVLLLGFAVFISVFYGLIGAALLSAVITAVKKLYVPRA